MAEEKNNLKDNENEINVPEEESNAVRMLRMRGISVEAEPKSEPIKKAGLFENFWYHNRGIFLAVLAGIVILSIGVFQMVTKTSPDIYIMYAGPHYYENTMGVMNAFTAAMEKDYNGDGDKIVNILQAVNYTEAQKAKLKEEHDKMAAEAKDGSEYDFSLDEGFLEEERNRFREEIMYGESIICILDPSLYEEIEGEKMLLTLEEALGYKPECAYDDYAIKFKDLPFAKYYKTFSELDDDTLIVVRRVTAMTSLKGKKAKERHENHVDFFKSVVEFTPPEE